MPAERTHRGWRPAARIAAVVALFAIAGDHLYEYSADHYSVIPTIGTLFLLNAIGGFGLGLALLVPVGRLLPRRAADLVTLALAAAGIALAMASLAALFISESTPLFGFMEIGYRTSIVIAIAAEAGTILALAALAIMTSSLRAGFEPVTLGT